MADPILRIALPGYPADTDTDPDHYAVIADEDNILIKEKERGTVTVAAGSSQAITHGLGYVPFVLCSGQLVGDAWHQITGDSSDVDAHIEKNTSQIIIYNSYATAKVFKYIIFYDYMVAPGLIGKSIRYHVVGETITKEPIFAIAKHGINVLETENPNDFIVNSKHNTLKIVGSGLYEPTVTHDVGVVEFRVAHGLEYRPIVIAAMREETNNEVTTQNNFSGSAGSYLDLVSAGANYTDLIFRISNRHTVNDLVAHIRYILFEIPL